MNDHTPFAASTRAAKAADRYAPDASELLDALSLDSLSWGTRAQDDPALDELLLDGLGITGAAPCELGLIEQGMDALLLDDLGITGARVLDARPAGTGIPGARRAAVRAVEGTAHAAAAFVLEDLDAADPRIVTSTYICFIVSEGNRPVEFAA
ncbi:hypothetical protein [Kitasatospora sp. McL0602]|uniref:hypothetical protein n=1 Tax=Kitasatospora sp. McL0602 TaxID=3439530 RepID=UPI003F89A3E2